MEYFEGSTIGLVISNKGQSFLVEMKDHRGEYKVIDKVSLETSRLFRPEHDAMYVSETGLIWKPEKG